MGKAELTLFFETLRTYYPKGDFDFDEWYQMFKNFNVNVLYEGLEIWRNGEKGAYAPSVMEIRMLDYVGQRNPDGIFMKAIEEQKRRIQRDAEEANEELRLPWQ